MNHNSGIFVLAATLVALNARAGELESIRMEPVFMILGQSAGAAANIAIDRKVAVQDVSYPELREKLEAEKQIVQFDRAPKPAVIGADKKIGAVVAKKAGDAYTLGNNVISATFMFKDGRLRLREISDVLNGTTLNCENGNVFSITQTDRRVVNATDCKLTAGASVSAVSARQFVV